MRKLLTLLSVGLFFVSPLSLAQKTYKSGELKTSVVELYTSEGCSSCPPADDFLSRLGKTKEAEQIVPLAFHVDYWDYIGWEDPYAKAEFTSRQRKVARMNNQSSIYTPEFVVDGAEARGSRKITRQLKKARQMLAEASIVLNLSADNDQFMAKVDIPTLNYEGEDTPEVYLAVYENGLSSRIDAGENHGRTLKHDYVVRHLTKAQATQAGAQHQFEFKLDPSWNRDELGVTVVVRLQDDGRTLQALKGIL